MKRIFTFSFLLFVFAFVQAQTDIAVNNGDFEDKTDMVKNTTKNWAIKGFYIEELHPDTNFVSGASGLAPALGVNSSQAFKVAVQTNAITNQEQVVTLSTEPIDISKRNPGKYYLKMNIKVANPLQAKRPFQFLLVATDDKGLDVTSATAIDQSTERSTLNATSDFQAVNNNYQPMYNVYEIIKNTSGVGGNAKYIRFKLVFGKNCPVSGNAFGTTFYFDNFTLTGPAENTTAISDLNSNSSVHVYPNPAKDYVVVQSTDGINEIAVYSISGAVQKKVLVNSQNYKLDISPLPNGIYIVAIRNSKGVVNKKISKF
jgi:hypothetical protein